MGSIPNGVTMRYMTYMAMYSSFIKYLEDPKLDIKDIMPDKIYKEFYKEFGEPSEIWIEHCNKCKQKLIEKRIHLYKEA